MADPLSSISCHAIFVFLVPALGTVVQMHYANSSPLHERPASIWIYMVSLLIFSVAFGYYIKSQNSSSASATYRKVSDTVALISGYMACAALISLLVPHSLEPLVFIITSVLLFIYFARNRITEAYKKLVSFAKSKWRGTESHNDPAVDTDD